MSKFTKDEMQSFKLLLDSGDKDNKELAKDIWFGNYYAVIISNIVITYDMDKDTTKKEVDSLLVCRSMSDYNQIKFMQFQYVANCSKNVVTSIIHFYRTDDIEENELSISILEDMFRNDNESLAVMLFNKIPKENRKLLRV